MTGAPAHFEDFAANGCGRCALGGTPGCKVLRWTEPLAAMRNVLLDRGLTETIKWGVPTYTYRGKNAAILSALKDACVLAFMHGASISDSFGLLEFAGPNSRIARQMKFTTAAEVHRYTAAVTSYIDATKLLIDLPAPSGLAHTPADPLPEALQHVLQGNPELLSAFNALTPGRKRSHVLYITGAKQAETQMRRAQRSIPLILAGRGWNERI